MNLLFPLLQAIVIVTPFVLGLYLVVVPKDKLVVQYQNVLLRYTRKPLKDEDFADAYRKIALGKGMGVCLIGIGIVTALLVSY